MTNSQLRFSPVNSHGLWTPTRVTKIGHTFGVPQRADSSPPRVTAPRKLKNWPLPLGLGDLSQEDVGFQCLPNRVLQCKFARDLCTSPHFLGGSLGVERSSCPFLWGCWFLFITGRGYLELGSLPLMSQSLHPGFRFLAAPFIGFNIAWLHRHTALHNSEVCWVDAATFAGRYPMAEPLTTLPRLIYYEWTLLPCLEPFLIVSVDGNFYQSLANVTTYVLGAINHWSILSTIDGHIPHRHLAWWLADSLMEPTSARIGAGFRLVNQQYHW